MQSVESPRVVITGIGIASPLGCTVGEYWERLCNGESGIAVLDAAYAGGGGARLGATVSEAALKASALSPALRRADKLSRMVAAATRAAFDGARIDSARVPSNRLGIVVGSSVGNLTETDVHLTRLCTRGPAAASPLLFPNLVLNAPASYASMETGATGANLTVSQLEASGETAVITGADLIRSGVADVVIAGGGDELSTIALHVYAESGALSSQSGGDEWSSPYDRDRNGVVLGEGAAMLVLEPLDKAIERAALIYAEIEHDLLFSVPAPPYAWPLRADDAAACMRGILPRGERVDLVFGSASSSAHLDKLELELFGRLLGDHASGTWLTSIKGAVGELGAAGAMTIATAALALHTRKVPPLCNLRAAEPDRPFRFASPRAATAPLQRVLVAGLARGGAGAAIMLARSERTNLDAAHGRR